MSIAYLAGSSISPKTKDVDKVDLLKLDPSSKTQLAPHVPSAVDANDTVVAPENVDRLLVSRYQHYFLVESSSALGHQSLGEISFISGPDISGSKRKRLSQSLLDAVEILTSSTEDQCLDSLTEDDYQGFIVALDKLIDVVGEDENHLYAILMHFIGKLIEKYQEKFDTTNRSQPSDPEKIEYNWESGMSLPVSSLEEAYGDDEPEYTKDMLIAVNPDYEDASEKWVSGSPLSASSLEEANDDDEPEYTKDMLIAVNPDYEDASEKWVSGSPLSVSSLEKTNDDDEPEVDHEDIH